jgi:aryl-alcohol dehydrogenase-like predicted oxidoreductase
MLSALEELEGLDFVMFPYNFIHARADYGEFLPAARKKGVGLIAIKPLAAGSIVKLDPKARPESKPENSQTELYHGRDRPLLPSVVKKLTESLNWLPDETLCQAALRFVRSRPFIATAMPGMFQDHELEENCGAVQRHLELSQDERAALNAARDASSAYGPTWLPRSYRWLDQCWRA